jgi:sn-glycerol 3-phosphate transport system ATP-binding protein
VNDRPLETPMAEISIRSVKKSFGRNQVIHDLDLDIQAGEFLVVLGPSGCGKSTVLRMIAGLEEISAGEIGIAGRIVNRLEPRQRGCAMVFQNYALYPHMTVAENIGYALKVAGLRRAERRARVQATAAIVGLAEYLERRPSELSGGQRQRVAMARAMIREPRVFLFDEPLSNLDAKLRVQMRIEIRRLHQRLKATSVFVTHDQVEAMTLADRIVVMNAGRIEQIGTPQTIYHRPETVFVAGFIGAPAMNLIDASMDGQGRIELGAPAPGRQAEGAQPIVLGVRPEATVLQPNGGGRHRMMVDFIEELGAARLLHGMVTTTSEPVAFVVQARSSEPVRAREEIAFDIPEDAMHLFDRFTGRRLPEMSTDLGAAAE